MGDADLSRVSAGMITGVAWSDDGRLVADLGQGRLSVRVP